MSNCMPLMLLEFADTILDPLVWPAAMQSQGDEASVLSSILAQVLLSRSFVPTTSSQVFPLTVTASGMGAYVGQGLIPAGPTSGQGFAFGNSSYTGETPFPGTEISVPPPSTVGHVYWPVAPRTPQQSVEYWLQPYLVQRKTLYRCTWPTCSATLPFTTKTKARTHVQKHPGITKLYECSCGVQFASLDTAKRHVSMQDKAFPCQFCLKHFARKDHRGAHQRKCRYGVQAA